MFINFCGSVLPASQKVLTVDNTAFNYGDSLFETILFRNNSVFFADEHYSRLLQGAGLLKFDQKAIPEKKELLSMTLELAAKNGLSDSVIRWQVFREGKTLSDTGKTGFVISCREIPAPSPETGVRICIFRDSRKSADRLSGIKHGNYLPYFLGSLHAKAHGWDDAVILNIHNRICESCIANIFIIKEGSILTPALSEGCIEGIYRGHLIKKLRKTGISVGETEITEEMLLNADEVFLTNSIREIIPVSWLESKTFGMDETKKIRESLKR